MVYLMSQLWFFLVLALLVGVATGWLSSRSR